jgi:hypothetical protein
MFIKLKELEFLINYFQDLSPYNEDGTSDVHVRVN